MKILATKSTVIISAILTAIMGFIVMVIVDPMIDGKDGLSVFALQLSFDKTVAKSIVSTWDIEAFREWIFTDYIYAVSYVLFFASLLLWLGKEKNEAHILYLTTQTHLTTRSARQKHLPIRPAILSACASDLA